MVRFLSRFRKRKVKRKGLGRDKFGVFKVVRGKKLYLHGDGQIFYFSSDRRGAIDRLPKHLIVKVGKTGLPFVKKK